MTLNLISDKNDAQYCIKFVIEQPTRHQVQKNSQLLTDFTNLTLIIKVPATWKQIVAMREDIHHYSNINNFD